MIQQGPIQWASIEVSGGRVVNTFRDGAGRSVEALHLDMVHGTAVTQHHRPLYVLLALLLAVAVGVSHGEWPMVLSWVFGAASVLCVVAYVLTRRLVLVVSAGASAIEVGVKGGKAGLQEAIRFAIQVDAAAIHIRDARIPRP